MRSPLPPPRALTAASHSITAFVPSFRLRRTPALALLAVLPAVAACGGGPSAPPPGGAPRPTALPNAPREWRVARGADSATYAVYLAARVRGPDGSSEGDDSTVTVARLRLTMGADGRAVAGVLDSIGVRGTGRVRTAAAGIDSVAFAGGVDAGGRVRDLAAAGASPGCDAPAAVFTSLVHDVVVPLPAPQLAVGMRWTDTVTATSCRGGITITTVAVRRHELRRAAALDGVDALEVARDSELRLEGTGARGDREYGVQGEGRERATLFVRPADGALIRLDGESSLDLEFSDSDGRSRFEQEARRTLRRHP